MEVGSDFEDPCDECIVKPCCSKTCNMYYKYFTINTFEFFDKYFFKDQQKEFLYKRGISIENTKKGRRSNK